MRTEILAELVRLDILKIKLVKMDEERGIYHKKTGILSDRLDKHFLHEGSNNFTYAAHLHNAESITFFYYDNEQDLDFIEESIEEFDEEWRDNEQTFDLSQEFLAQLLAERDRRKSTKKPIIKSISLDELVAGSFTKAEITKSNLEVEAIAIIDDELIEVFIRNNSKTTITVEFAVSSEHSAQALETLLKFNLSISYQTALKIK